MEQPQTTERRSGEERRSPNEYQVAGSHYREINPAYQHWDLVAEHDLDYFMGQVTKYVSRWRYKNGVQDLEKSIHYLEKLQSLYQCNPRSWCVRRAGTPGHTFYEFCRSHKLTRTETLIMEMCITYIGPDDLERLRLLLLRAIAEAHTAQAQQTIGHAG